MDIKAALQEKHSRSQALQITNYIGDHSERFDCLMTLFLGKEYRLTQRAAMVVGYCADRYPALLVPYLPRIISNLRNEVPNAVKRNTVRLLQHVDIPASLLGETTDVCFTLLQSSQEPPAVKVFAMSVLGRICEREPDLIPELKMVIEEQLPYGSAAFKNRAAKVLHQLSRSIRKKPGIPFW